MSPLRHWDVYPYPQCPSLSKRSTYLLITSLLSTRGKLLNVTVIEWHRILTLDILSGCQCALWPCFITTNTTGGITK